MPMKTRIIILAIITLSTVAISQTTTKTVWDGVYSDDQSRRGQTVFRDNCASCHGESLACGEEAPELAGPVWMSNWNGLTVGDLSERIRISMPPQNPDKLTRQQNIDVISFILRSNNFPVGKDEMPTQAALLKEIKITASK